ncbi:ABC transporter permease [Streptomyces sp. NPDC058466]|uniref:ABC transporter permease n=1 Tax=Streptomyces sp. NPDC058466 TaxID=3346512 RepID=UPI00365E7868
MTALATPAPPATGRPAGRPSPVRWLLRLHRPDLLAWAGLVIVLGTALICVGGPLTDASAHAWRQIDACRTANCGYDQAAILRYKDWYGYTTYAVLAVPFLVAAWSGATLTSRELENGTAHLVWTQSVAPIRWLAAKLAVPAALITVGTGLLALLHHWAWSTGQGRIDTAKRWYDTGTFAANGTVPVALALAGLAIGALIGLVLPNSLAALVGSVFATGGLWGALSTATPHLWPTVTKVAALKRDGPSGSGISVSQGVLTSSGERIADAYCGSGTYASCQAAYDKLDAVSFYNDYHPQSHYWPLQLTASALVLAVTAALTVAAFRLLKRTTGATDGGKAATP